MTEKEQNYLKGIEEEMDLGYAKYRDYSKGNGSPKKFKINRRKGTLKNVDSDIMRN